MKVALYTDAGIKNGVATWATVALVEGQEPIEASGRLRAETDCSTTAESRAVANAIHSLARAGHLPPGTTLLVYSDSRSAVDRLAGRLTKRPNSTAAKAVATCQALAARGGVTLKAQWIPGHKPDDHSPHARWNNRCDALCRAARKLPAPKPPQRRKPSSYRKAPPCPL